MTREFPLTGYRNHNDQAGRNNKEAAVEFLANLKYIPKDENGKFDIELLNELPVPEGSAAPYEMFRRGLMEIAAHSWLNNDYPEWMGDSYDDADADVDAITYLHEMRDFGPDRLNSDLNTTPTKDSWGYDVYPEGNILSFTNSAVVDELLTLMKGRNNND